MLSVAQEENFYGNLMELLGYGKFHAADEFTEQFVVENGCDRSEAHELYRNATFLLCRYLLDLDLTGENLHELPPEERESYLKDLKELLF